MRTVTFNSPNYLCHRMPPYLAIEFIELIEGFLPNDPRGVLPYLQVLSIIRFLAEGHYQKGLGMDLNHPMSQTSISRYLHNVIPAINWIANRLIRFPNTPDERLAIQRRLIKIHYYLFL